MRDGNAGDQLDPWPRILLGFCRLHLPHGERPEKQHTDKRNGNFKSHGFLLCPARRLRGPLLALVGVIAGGGALYYMLAQVGGEPSGPTSLAEAFYGALSMMFLQAGSTFPDVWYLQLFYFVMPLLGLVILAQGVADFGVLLFNRRARGEAWEMAVADTYSNHIIVIGLGHLGFRIARALHELAAPFVIVEKKDGYRRPLCLGVG